jgi:hypothetical protein
MTHSPAAAFEDDFESYSVGSFPAADWLDAGLVDPNPPNPPDPSSVIAVTPGPMGSPTQVLEIVPALAQSQGAYRFIPLANEYHVMADVRVDRFCDGPAGPASDWAMDVGVGQFIPGTDLCCTPTFGIYASSFTQGWRLYVVGAVGAFADIDLGLPVELGRWYTLALDVDAVGGAARSRIFDAAGGGILVDQNDVIPGWTPADGAYDVTYCIDGESGSNNTVSNLAVADNFRYGLQPTAVEPRTWGAIKATFSN